MTLKMSRRQTSSLHTYLEKYASAEDITFRPQEVSRLRYHGGDIRSSDFDPFEIDEYNSPDSPGEAPAEESPAAAMSTDIPQFSIQWMTSWTPSCNVSYWLESMPFRVGLKVDTHKHPKPVDFKVELWTDMYHKHNSEGEWHAVPLEYLKILQAMDDKTTVFLFGVEIIPTALGFASFTFRVRHKFQTAYTWADTPENDGHVKVKLPVREHTVWIQEPKSAKITHNIYIGNFSAGKIAPEEGFDSLLNMADDAHLFQQQFTRPIIFKKFAVPFGVYNEISSDVVKEAVAWLRIMSDCCTKVMVCSRTGHARSGSILIAFIFFMNPDLNFEEAYAFVNKRTMVIPHKGLKDILHELYPRS